MIALIYLGLPGRVRRCFGWAEMLTRRKLAGNEALVSSSAMDDASKSEILEAIHQFFGATTSYFEKIDGRLDRIEARLGGLETRVTSLEGRMRGLELRMDRMEARMDRLEDCMRTGF